jgi:hypothetical protein
MIKKAASSNKDYAAFLLEMDFLLKADALLI